MTLGIPDRSRSSALPQFTSSQAWNFVIHEHQADRAGLHYDLRLVDPSTSIAHSWAVRNLPMLPGQKSLAIKQPDHTEEYTHFEGVIEDGYGKGKVSIYKAGTAEVLKSDGAHFRFNLYDGTRTMRFSLIHTGGTNWLFFNHTSTEENKPYIPRSKPSFKSIKPEQIQYDNSNQVLAPKIDGAANIFDLRGEKGVDIYSYRPSRKSQELIDHTYRLQAHKIQLPKDLKNTVLMGEVFAQDPQGRALPPQDTTGALVSNVWKARNKVPGFGIALYDVLRYKGQPFADRPYGEKLPILQNISSRVPQLSTPPFAFTPEEKRQLLTRVSFKQHPLTEEGFVVYNLDESVPTKAKFKDDYDVYIREIHLGQGKHSQRMGFIRYSYTPDGPIIGQVGGGFSDSLREAMALNPNAYIGKPIRVYALGQTPGGALKVPQFKDFRTAEMFPKQASLLQIGFHKTAERNEALNAAAVGAVSTGVGLIPFLRGPEAAFAAAVAPRNKKRRAAEQALAYGLAGTSIPIIYGVAKYLRTPKASYDKMTNLIRQKRFIREATKRFGKYHVSSAITGGLGSGYGYYSAVKEPKNAS